MSKVKASPKSAQSPGNGITINADLSVTLSAERAWLCVQAAQEIEALALVLPDLVPNTEEARSARLVVRGIAARILQLDEALMAGIDDEVTTEGEIHKTISLKFMEVCNG